MATGQGSLTIPISGYANNGTDYVETMHTISIPIGASIDIYPYPLDNVSGISNQFNPTEVAILSSFISMNVIDNNGSVITVATHAPGLRLNGNMYCRYVWADFP